MSDKNDEKYFEKGDIALFLVPITAFSYGLVYLFKLGELHYYGVPSSFIELNLNTLTGAILSISPMLLLFVFEYYLILKKRKGKVPEKNRKKSHLKILVLILSLNLIIVFYASFIYFLFKYYGLDTIILVIMTILITVFFLLISIFYKKRKYFYTLILSSSFLLLLSYFYGISINALEKIHTIVEYKSETYLFIDFYDKKAILTPLNRKTNEISGEFIIEDISGDGYKLKREWMDLKKIK